MALDNRSLTACAHDHQISRQAEKTLTTTAGDEEQFYGLVDPGIRGDLNERAIADECRIHGNKAMRGLPKRAAEQGGYTLWLAPQRLAKA